VCGRGRLARAPQTLTGKGRDKHRGLFYFHDSRRGRCPTCAAERASAMLLCERILALMDKKEIESPKLTARFLIWISGFMIVVFALIAHFVWRIF
jgi:hypothetical protein